MFYGLVTNKWLRKQSKVADIVKRVAKLRANGQVTLPVSLILGTKTFQNGDCGTIKDQLATADKIEGRHQEGGWTKLDINWPK